MILNSEDIYDNIESFRNRNGFSQDKMAEMIGMSGKSAYSAMIKYRRMKFEYLINLINNSGISIDQLFRSSTNSQPKVRPYENQEIINSIDDAKIVLYTCPDCINKEKKIEDLKSEVSELNNELNEIRNKYISLLENRLGKKTG